MIPAANRLSQVEEYYFSRKLAEVRRLDAPTWRTINLGIGSPDLAPSPATVQALVRSAEKDDQHGYQNYKGIPALREAIRGFYERTYRVSLDPETMILPLMGSKEGIFHISMAFVNPGDEVLIPDPGYPTYGSATRLVGGSARPYTMDESRNWSIDVKALAQQDLSRVKLMWINFPHMPTGCIASLQEMLELVELARKHHFLIVNDNPYSLIMNETPMSILAVRGAEDVAMELNSLSKSHNMAGWRIGWVAGMKEHIDAVLNVKSNLDSGMFLSMQHAAVEALAAGPAWYDALNNVYRARRKVAHRILDALGCHYDRDQPGLFVWARVPMEISSVEEWVDQILHGTRVFLAPGNIFGRKGDRHLRLSLCATEQKMEEALARIRHWQTSVIGKSQNPNHL
ncbi:MAG: aminotransferase class I/II-fold pyridoxal phosphate-dependent enzyme [Cytophagales bacterium]|nr:aminotransferase class I/II-fold pyridoxal phosphate-dependent enzyme [Cytophagales bacterium]